MKFKLTTTTKEHCWITLYQIQALKDFWNISKWELWWWIEKESNLSQDWEARVHWNAEVFWNAQVYWNARISWEIKLQSWQCFARKEKDWDVSEIENEWVILLIKDYKPVKETEIKKMTVKEIIEKLWYEIEIVK